MVNSEPISTVVGFKTASVCPCLDHQRRVRSSGYSPRFGKQIFYVLCYVLIFFNIPVSCAVLKLDGNTFENSVGQSEIVFVNFYADWCRFSQMLTPIFEEASNKFNGNTRVSFASVDCDKHNDVAQKYHINKYPTLKLFRNGQLAKREYRGQRSTDAIAAFVQSQLENNIQEFASTQDLESKIDSKKRNVIAYFTAKEGGEWDNLMKIASNLREECTFSVGVGEPFKQQTMGGNNVAFRDQNTQNSDQVFSGNLGDFEYTRQWITDKCIPLVREITFENAEELTEEGLPFLILFRHPDDTAIVETYKTQVASELADQKTAVNFLTADGKKFAHPLHHLGKAEKDLPVLAIDSFRHMYLFPNMNELTVPGKLRQFILDLHSGKLHREFHHGPDATPPAVQEQPPAHQGGGPPGHVPPQDFVQPKTSPPESVFDKLKPSRNRYTILKDEL